MVLERLSRSFGPFASVAWTAALFGPQHLSAFATSQRDVYDIATNVLVSGLYGFALADFTTILTVGGLNDVALIGTLVVFIAFGLLVLRGIYRRRAGEAEELRHDNDPRVVHKAVESLPYPQ